MAAKIFMEMPNHIKMPAIGLGTWQVTDETELVDALNTALELGYRHIDTAFVYQNETFIGRVLKNWFASGKLERKDVFITTKLPVTGVHPDRVEMFLKKSLENLQLDYVDLYLIHFPISIKPVEGHIRPPLDNMVADTTDHLAVWKKMEEQVDAGRTKAIGLSNFNVRQIDKIFQSARIKPACLQVELHVYLQQRELVNFCIKNGIVVVGYSPLGTPGYNKFIAKFGMEPIKLPDMLNDPVIRKIGEKYSKSSAQVMLRYMIQKNIVPIPKSVSPQRLKENINIFDFVLSGEDMKALDDLDHGEDSRACNFKLYSSLSNHPEWPLKK